MPLRANSSISSIGARALTAICASNSGGSPRRTIEREPRGIVDQQPHRRQALGGAKIRSAQSGFGQVGDDLDRALRHRVAVMMDVGDDRPAVGEQRADDRLADPLAAAGDDCGAVASCGPYHGQGWIARALAYRAGQCPNAARRSKPRASLAASPRRSRRAAGRPGRPLEPEPLRPFDMRIARDGTWYHQGAPIERPAMVRLFATVLRREPDGSHVLVTPVEKLAIEVEATAFRATQMTMRRDRRAAPHRPELDSGDALIVGPGHPLTIVETPTARARASPCAFGLEAELARPLYYELAEIALAEAHDPPGVWSDGCFFPLSAMSLIAANRRLARPAAA
jgi:hypothetical protein